MARSGLRSDLADCSRGGMDHAPVAGLAEIFARLRERCAPAVPDRAHAVGGRVFRQAEDDRSPGWLVQLMAQGRVLAALEPYRARELAAELVQMADVIEGARDD